MTISLKHTFTSPKADGVDSTLVQPSNWNAEHTITLAAGKVLGRDTSSAGAMQELPLAFDTAGNAALSATGSFKTAVGTTAERPGTPVTGMFRFNSSLTKFEGYNGTAWSPVGGGGATISDTAPASPTAGDLWWNSSNGQMYTYYNDGTSSQWVVANSFTGGSAYLPLSGGTLTGALLGTTATFTSFSGDGSALTNLNGANVQNSTLAVGKLSATGTPSSSTYLRGDNTWATVSAGGVTSVATGTGLTGGTITTSGTISLVTTAGAVGTYAFMLYSGATGYSGANPGATLSGSVLYFAGVVSSSGSTAISTYYATRPSGTWQLMGSYGWDTGCGISNPTSLMIRIA